MIENVLAEFDSNGDAHVPRHVRQKYNGIVFAMNRQRFLERDGKWTPSCGGSNHATRLVYVVDYFARLGRDNPRVQKYKNNRRLRTCVHRRDAAYYGVYINVRNISREFTSAAEMHAFIERANARLAKKFSTGD